jgi:hypothetical protein
MGLQYKHVVAQIGKLACTTAALSKSMDVASELQRLKIKLNDDLDQMIKTLADEL